MQKTRVLFVCLGNICRSPSAEGVFRQQVQQLGLLQLIEHDSCGTADYHVGAAPDARAMAHAEARGIDISDLRGRQIEVADFSRFDLILAADRDNLARLKALCPQALQHKVQLMLDYSSAWRGQEVPDPYYGGARGFETVLDMLQDMSSGLMEAIRRR